MADYYGLLAFGLCAVLIIIMGVCAAWVKVFRPDLQVRLQIEKEQTTQTANMKSTAESQERIATAQATTSKFLESMIERCITKTD